MSTEGHYEEVASIGDLNISERIPSAAPDFSRAFFIGATYIIPLADVTHVEKNPESHHSEIFRHMHGPQLLRIWLKGATGSSPAILLYGDEIEEFIRAWFAYRHEQDNGGLVPVREVRHLDLADSDL